MTPERYAHTRGYEDAMAWVMVWIKRERESLMSPPIDPRHVQLLKKREDKLRVLSNIERRVVAAHKEAQQTADAAK